MSGPYWLDRFTGTRYRYGDAWVARVRRHLAEQLRARGLADDPARAADRVACFWRQSYYESLFPLRFGCAADATGALQTPITLPSQPEVDLEALAGGELRHGGSGGAGLPPILPDPARGAEGWLLSDRLLLEAALLNALLADAAIADDQRHLARLAALTYPFHDDLGDLFGAHGPAISAIGAALGGSAAPPASLQEAIQAVRDRQFGARQVRLALVAVQRVKQYVFDTPGLNEIRGGSTLLDQITEDLDDEVGRRLGPEMTLRAAGSTLLFLAPAGDSHDWAHDLRRAYYAGTGAAFPAAATVTIAAQDLFDHYGSAVASVYRRLDSDRAQAAMPLHTTLPFEERCVLCGVRAADGWDASPGEDNIPPNRRPLCRVCVTKRRSGQSGRRAKVSDLLTLLDPGRSPSLARLGVQPGDTGERVANDLDALIPPGVRRRLIGVVYGDGNNFGAVSLGLPDIALGLQWAARVRSTTRTAAAVALGRATQQVAMERGWTPGDDRAVFEKIPFQALALGGDDLSLFAWGPVALHFAAEFVRLTDLEFAAHSDPQRLSDEPLSFSLGVLVTDEKTPVRKSVHFTEDELLAWAKRAARQTAQSAGTIALLYTPTAEGVPSDLKSYCTHTYALGAPGFQVYTTLRPFAARELGALLQIARGLVQRGDGGRIQRLVAALYDERQGVLAGLLHYAYQRGRTDDKGWIATLEDELAKHFAIGDEKLRLFGIAPRRPLGCGPPPDPAHDHIRFSPLWDLVEIAKIIS